MPGCQVNGQRTVQQVLWSNSVARRLRADSGLLPGRGFTFDERGGSEFDHEHRGGYGFALGIFQTSSSKGKSTALRSDWWCVDAKNIGIVSVARRRRWFWPLPGCQFTVSECFGPSCWVRPPPSLAAFGLVLASCHVEGLPSMSVADLRGAELKFRASRRLRLRPAVQGEERGSPLGLVVR